MELWIAVMKDASCIVCGSSGGICCTAAWFCELHIYVSVKHLYVSRSVPFSTFRAKPAHLCHSLMISLPFFCFLRWLSQSVLSLSMLTVLPVNIHLIAYVCMSMTITKSAFLNQHPNRGMILPYLKILQGKEGKENNWRILAVKLLGTEFVQSRLGSPPSAFAVDTFMVCSQLPPASPAESSRTVALGRETGENRSFFQNWMKLGNDYRIAVSVCCIVLYWRADFLLGM